MIINFIHIPKNGGTSIHEICNKTFHENKLVYNGHPTDVYNKNLSNQLVVIRNPIERFISSVYYAIQKWSHEPQIQYLISQNIDTPEKWVQIWSNPKHSHYKHLMSEMMNKSHYIGNKLHEYKWTYSPQYLWINNPKYVIIMDNFTSELQYFLKRKNIKLLNIDHKNSTHHKNNVLSKKSLDFLRKFYKKDFEIYEKYKYMSIKQRL